MKRSHIIVAVPLVFLIGAVLAWIDHHLVKGDKPSSEPGITRILGGPERAVLLQKDDADSFSAEGLDEIGGMISSIGPRIDYCMRWAEHAPEEMFIWLISEHGESWATPILFKAWARQNMEAALAAVPKIPDIPMQQKALVTTLETLCQTNPQRAGKLLKEQIGLFSEKSTRLWFTNYESPKPVLDLLLSLPASDTQTWLLAAHLTSLASWASADHLALAQSVWQEAPSALRHELVEAGFHSDKGSSFEGLMEISRELAESTGTPDAAEQFFKDHGAKWAQRDPTAALDWVLTHLKGSERAAKMILENAPPDRQAEIKELLHDFSSAPR